ncbi:MULTISPECIES: anti-sigma factor family protein [Halomonas]|uniref:Mycothiol system anti-sigma-R factor n=2 Tax=Halomonas TaxID=2745 RepID=A0A2N7TLB9_9GAMM|nr:MULTISPECIES: zf-HC2 domain-containing protein [Halomonas]MDI5934540.1 zf-HC2 domain-containing protein [Halomonas kalidii]PMR68987.1 mycothiol system anti-sigma-R factor [Halomonas heilongjiangensis]PXX90055.1 mycothiol system anti-sigma-R factor [Halomonas heilongjiangensis]
MNPREPSCEEVIERLFDYLDRELDHRQADDIERHLSRCRDCFTRAEFEKRLRARVEAAGTVKAPTRLRHRIRDLLDQFDD